MLITDKKSIEKYSPENNLWVGIPSIAVTKGGRNFLTFYSGGTKEEIGNFCILLKSENGKDYTDTVAVCFEEGSRCFDPCLWIDPLDRLWFTWAKGPDKGVYAAICENPDSDEIVFGEEFYIAPNILMNKPTVLSTGEWLFPIAVWEENLYIMGLKPDYKKLGLTPGSFAYATYDNGKTFKKLGTPDVKNRSFDEHMFLELENGVVRVFVRTHYGIGAADSYDSGLHWGTDFDTKYGGPCSRFHITRLPSGRVLLINHYNFTKRNNLYAMLSEDDGKTFPYKLLLDERDSVSYPDADISKDGFIHITYDRDRGAFCTRLDDVLSKEREILTAKITEEDIISGSLVNKNSFLKHIVYKLTEYKGENKNPYNEIERLSDEEYASFLGKTNENEDAVISKIFENFDINCSNIHNVEAKKLDMLIEKYKTGHALNDLSEIISLVRSAQVKTTYDTSDVVDKICSFIADNLEANITLSDLSRKFHFSSNYIRHIFKKKTGMTVTDFKINQKIKKAKLLLKMSDCKITDIASSCGFESSAYFTETFTKITGISPRDYRKTK